ncbi:MAG: invasion associated locus B family protein [Rhodospirillales bacterium]|nr:invasion associated locus B family protein [Rhodospirillales bacterium]MCW8860896.1 invasion associated locus B family protein [Rhodospirillales bacterium]MCW8952462.1 invasion associated locus B family protein [Rhodospirillales bacterium]MCW8970903.1 invasion associated locus B family protein [Rhodospirillales bacterium]MCW9003396.1 invasion associated locus B family protein [Rhodospirillales bacterium]
MKIFIAFFTALIFFPTAAMAGEIRFLETHGDWSVFADAEKNADYCYIGSQPKTHEEGGRQRGDIYLIVSHQPKDKALNVVRVVVGYTLKEGSDVTVTIGDQTFSLFSDGENAWARDAATDVALVRAMRAGSKMVIKGTSARGTATVDAYSLSGFTAAHESINAACGVKGP